MADLYSSGEGGGVVREGFEHTPKSSGNTAKSRGTIASTIVNPANSGQSNADLAQFVEGLSAADRDRLAAMIEDQGRTTNAGSPRKPRA